MMDLICWVCVFELMVRLLFVVGNNIWNGDFFGVVGNWDNWYYVLVEMYCGSVGFVVVDNYCWLLYICCVVVGWI